MNWLLIALPAAVALHWLQPDWRAINFLVACVAITPLAAWMGKVLLYFLPEAAAHRGRYNRTEVPFRTRSVVAIYPGSFDPITNGHLDLIARCAPIVDRLIVAILRNESKEPLFSVEERVSMLREVVAQYANVEVDSFGGLLVDYAASRGANLILRGIRAISDYEYELQMALMNRRLRPEIETVFMMAGEAYSFISSKLVKEVIGLGGNISGLVPPPVEARLKSRILGER